MPDAERLKYCFEQGTSAYAKVRLHDGWYVGVHMEGLPFMELVVVEGAWSIGRKKNG